MLETLNNQLGPLFYPLLMCSFLASLIVLERFVILSVHSISGQLIKAGLATLAHYQEHPRAILEELMSLWLQGQQKKLASGIRLLHIVALVSPLLGLLGTVLGLIQAFDSLALHRGPIDPSLLADGLGLAMKTTAFGLVIAIPALFSAYLYQLWVDSLIHACERELNLSTLRNNGICTDTLA